MMSIHSLSLDFLKYYILICKINYSQILFMEDIIESFAEKLGIAHNSAKKGISITSQHFLQNVELIKASGLLSMLSSSLTNMFSTDKKNESKTSQENIPPEKVIEKIFNECFNCDKQKEKRYMKKQ